MTVGGIHSLGGNLSPIRMLHIRVQRWLRAAYTGGLCRIYADLEESVLTGYEYSASVLAATLSREFEITSCQHMISLSSVQFVLNSGGDCGKT